MGEASALTLKAFSVEGMHCVRCIRKIQAIGESCEGVSRIDVDFSESRITTEVTPFFQTNHFQKLLVEAGFQIRPLNLSELEKPANYKTFLMRIGVAGACAGNIMLISASEYAGSGQSEVGSFLRWINFAFFLPVLFFCSWPIFSNCFHSFKIKKLSVDLPLSIAILGASFLSFYNLVAGKQEVYFDSLAMFIFFLLSSRYIIFRAQAKFLSPVELKNIFSQETFRVLTNEGIQEIKINELRAGQKVLMEKGSYFPVDSELLSSSIEIDNSLITGESLPVTVGTYSKVFAGAKLLSANAEVQVLKSLSDSRLTALLEKINRKLKVESPVGSLADRGAQYLTLVTVLVSVVAAVLFYAYNIEDGLDRILALLVISCPCALAIATPLAHSLTVKKAMKEGILFKTSESLEIFSNIKTYIFDKTGTLTTGRLEVTQWTPEIPSQELKNIIGTMESNSEHPVAAAIKRSLGEFETVTLEDFLEIPGKGIQARFRGSFYEIRRSEESAKQGVSVFKDGKAILTAHLVDDVKSEIHSVIRNLRESGKYLYLVTGDQDHVARQVGKSLGFKGEEIISECTPESKASYVEKIKSLKQGRVAFIGDGINDALAMASSDASVSMNSSAEIAFKSSSIHLLTNNLENLFKVEVFSRVCLKTIGITLTLSFIYNLSFGVLALSGMISPLIAVVIMPLSSLSVVLITLWNILRR